MPPAPSSTRALQAILPQIADNKPYEAHQKARTFVSRYVKAGQYEVAIDVLFQSARELLKAGHTGSGVDLGSFLLDVYDTAKVGVNLESRGRMTQLIALTGSSGAWRKTLIDKTIALAGGLPNMENAQLEIQNFTITVANFFIAVCLYNILPMGPSVTELFLEGSFEAAEPYLLNSASRDSARLLAQMMFEWWRDGANLGAYAIRGTIPYLLNTSIVAARTFLTTFIGLVLATPRRDTLINSHFPSPIPLNSPNSGRSLSTRSFQQDEIQITTDPTLNFLQLAIQTCQRAGWGNEATTDEEEAQNRASRDAWLRLAARYRTRVIGGEAMRDEKRLQKGLQAIESLGAVYFDVPLARKGANPLQDMMSSLFGGGDAPEALPARKLRRALPAGLD
ncbi:hypothetical protein FRC10_001493 [Ceratobasidium sp. 414]|nr:hypothetical protein FRC10_001493 [Ceratobasidium sp. 414]